MDILGSIDIESVFVRTPGEPILQEDKNRHLDERRFGTNPR